MNKVDYFLPLLPYPSLYYIPHYNFLYYSTHLYCPFILFHNIRSLLQPIPFLYPIPSYSPSPYYIPFYYTPLYYIPSNSLNPNYFFHSQSPLYYIPHHFIIFTLYYTHFTTHPNFTFPFPTQNPFITFFLSHHLNPTNPSIYYFITFNLTNQNSSSSPLFNPQTSTSFYYIFLFPNHPFLHSPNIPSFYYFTPYPTFINHLKKILPHIHNPYHFISHIYSLLNITFIVFYLTLLTLNLIFHFISINQSFLLTYLSYFPNYSPSKYHLFPFKSI